MSIYEITTTIKKIIVILLHNWFEKFWNKIKLYEKYKKKKVDIVKILYYFEMFILDVVVPIFQNMYSVSFSLIKMRKTN